MRIIPRVIRFLHYMWSVHAIWMAWIYIDKVILSLGETIFEDKS